MSCIGAEGILMIVVLFLLMMVLPIIVSKFFIKCKTGWKIVVVLLSFGIDVGITLNESSVCKYTTGNLDCSLYLILGLLAIIPVLISLSIKYICNRTNKEIKNG